MFLEIEMGSTFNFGVLVFLDVDADYFIFDEILGVVDGIDVGEVHGDLDEILAGFGIIHFLF